MAVYGPKRKDEEERERAAAQASPSPEQPKKAQEDHAQEAQKGVQVAIGPTNRPFTEEQSFLLNQRKAVRDTGATIVKTGELDRARMPETLQDDYDVLNERNKSGKTALAGASDWGANDVSVDFSKIKDNRQAAYFASSLEESEREGFLKDYAKYSGQSASDVIAYSTELVGSRLFADKKNSRERNAENLSALADLGLFDANGNDINVNTASPQMMVQGIQGIADKDRRKAAAEAFEALTQTPGSAFYGFTTDADLNAFRDSAELDESTYKAYVSDYRTSFYAGEGHEAENAQTYSVLLEDIQNQDSGYVRRVLTQALEDAYKATTYAQGAPSLEDVPGEEAPEQLEQPEKKPGIIDGIKNALGFGKATQEGQESVQAAAPEQIAPQASEAPSVTPRESTAAYTIFAQRTGSGSYVPPTLEGDVLPPAQAKEQEEAPQYVPTRDAGDVVAMMKQGKSSMISPDDPNKAYVDELYRDINVRRLNGMTEEAEWAMAENNGAEIQKKQMLGTFGTTIYTAYQTIHGSDFPQELYGDSMMILNEVVRDADAAIEGGQISVNPDLENAYEAFLEAYPEQKAKVDSIQTGWNDLIEYQNQLKTEREEQTKESLQEAKTAILNGNASAEQLELWRSNMDVKEADVQKAMYGTDLYISFATARSEYWVGGAYESSDLRRRLDASGVTDREDFRWALQTQMRDIMHEDTQWAVSLGLSPEEYYAKIGGMSADQLANRAYLRMQEQASAITDEDQALLDNAGVGAVKTVTTGVSTGANSFISANIDGLYKGYTLGRIQRTAAEMEHHYLTEFGAYGADYYRKDLQALINSGLLTEEMSGALSEGLSASNNIFDLGINPESMGGMLSTARQARDRIARNETMMTENATPGERKWYTRIASVTENSLQAAENIAISAVTGNSLRAAKGMEMSLAIGNSTLGFVAAYGVPHFGRQVDARLSEGYSLNSAKGLAAIDTGVMIGANLGTNNMIIKQITGGQSLERAGLLDAMLSNPSGLVRARAAVAKFSQTMGKNVISEIGDEFKENFGQNATDIIYAPLFQRADAGEDIGVTDMILAPIQALPKVKAFYEGAQDAAKKTMEEAFETAITTSMLTLAGSGLSTYRSVRAAQDVVSGRSGDVEAVMEAARQDAQDEGFVSAMEQEARTAQIEERTVEVLNMDDGRDGKMAAAQKTQEQADSHRAEKEASAARMENARAAYYERKDSGDIDAANAALMDYAKAKQGLDEHTREEAQKSYEAQQIREDKMQDARRQATAEIAQEEAQGRAALENSASVRVMTRRERIDQITQFIEDVSSIVAEDPNAELTQEQVDTLESAFAERARLEEELEAIEHPADRQAAGEAREAADKKLSQAQAEQDAQMNEWMMREQAQAEADEMAPVYRQLRETRVYVDDSQKANILHATGLKSLPQVNRKFGLRLTSDKGNISLDGSFFADLAELAPGRIDADSLHPEETLLDIMNRKKELKAMQASVGETAYEKYLPDGTFYATADPVMQKTASEIYKATGIDVVVAPLARNIRALYDRENGRIVLSNRIGAGEAMRKAAMHELTHYIEDSAGYDAYKNAALKAAYMDDQDGTLRKADEARIRETYESSGIELTPDGVVQELVAEATEKIIEDRNGDIISRLLSQNERGMLARLRTKLGEFLARQKAKREGSLERYNAIRDAYSQLTDALQKKGKWSPDDSGIDPTVNLDTQARNRGDVAHGAQGEQMQFALAPNQFGNETAQRLTAIGAEVKDILRGSQHEIVGDRQMLDSAWDAVNARGADIVADELLGKQDAWDAQDNVTAALCMVLAEQNGDLSTEALLALRYDSEGSRQGLTLQKRKILSRLTPQGAMADAVRKADRANERRGIPAGGIPVGDGAPKKKIDTQDTKGSAGTHETVARIYDRASELVRELDTLPGDVSRDNPWGLPLSDEKMELIRRYELMSEELPGTRYNTATVKQRMLAAIIAMDNTVDGAGFEAVCQQLEAMKQGLAVVTKADLNYIASQTAEFKAIEGNDAEAPVTQAGKEALGRAFQAQDNTVQATLVQKWGSLRYTNMLSAPATSVRNVTSNIVGGAMESTATRIAEHFDKRLEKKTDNRTTAAPTREERKAGRDARSREIAQTLMDYCVNGVDTSHSRRYATGGEGRVFQTQFLEACRSFVDFTMQLGDRPFYEQSYTEELSIVKRLNMKIRENGQNGEIITRPMTEAEMVQEATVRALKRVYQEDSQLASALNAYRASNPIVDLACSTLMPFVKTPANVAMRSIEYSPVGLGLTLARRAAFGVDAGTDASISQRDYVMGLGRGLTGTGLLAAGISLAAAGVLMPGREAEDNTKRRDALNALGRPYGMYIDILGAKHEIDWALPMSSGLAMGAELFWSADAGEGIGSAVASAIGGGVIDQVLSTPMLSAMQDIFNGYDDSAKLGEKILKTTATSLVNQTFSPSIIRAFAKATDPYARDTSSQSYIWSTLCSSVIQYWPGLRQTLPVKTDVTGDPIRQNGYWNQPEHQSRALQMLDSFFTPTATIGEKNDDALFELLDLSYREDDTACLPSALVSKNAYSLKLNKSTAGKMPGFAQYAQDGMTMELTDSQKRQVNADYGNLLFNGDDGRPYKNERNKMESFPGLRAVMEDRARYSGQEKLWSKMSDGEKVSLVSKMATRAKTLIVMDEARKRNR